MSKLTLSVDGQVISRAKRYARDRGVSISKMVEGYLTTVVEGSSPPPRDAPIVGSLRGSLKKANLQDYKRHLAAKYR